LEEASKNRKEKNEKIEKIFSNLPPERSDNLKKEIQTFRSNRIKELKAFRIKRVIFILKTLI
jgi:cystathionine beta-lyase family protein involved in aluminum resistance